MVYYRKYRPQTLSDLVGQEVIAQTLQKAVETGRVAHAYLFTGPRGVGKTSTARILAKMVNCETEIATGSSNPRNDKVEIPCNKCSACLSISDGSCLDLIEIDAASNRGIDDIRELRDKIKLSPTSLKKKVYIIDEVHMLTTEAFNALLKTLEEPPEHVLFILATTEVQKIPQTILSRVQRLDFKVADSENLFKLLKKVAAEEKLEVEDEALALLAKRAEGSFRDGVKLLDQLSSGGKKITREMVEESLRVGNFESSLALLEKLISSQTAEALGLLDKEIKSGINFKEFLYSLLDLLRAMLLISQGVGELVKKEYTEEKFEELKKLAEKASVRRLIEMIELFQGASEKLKFASIPALVLEVAVIESSEVQRTGELSSVVSSQIGDVKKETVILNDSEQVRASGSEKSQDGTQESRDLSTSSRDDKEEEIASSTSGEIRNDGEDKKVSSSKSDSGDLNTLTDKWDYILEMVRSYNFSLGAMLKGVKLDSCLDGQLIVKVPYSFHQRILETPRNRELLESVLTDVLSKQIKVSCELDERPVRVEELANVEVAADDEVIKIASEIFNS